MLKVLDALGYFDNPPPNTMNEAGTGYRLDVNLALRKYSSFWSEKPQLYQQLIEAIDLDALESYQPEESLLVVWAYDGITEGKTFAEWPSKFSIPLAEVGKEGKWIRGEALAFAWEQINNSQTALTGMLDNGIIYAIGLQIEGISSQSPPFNCWFK